jgi:hypothetical protein
MTLPGWSTKDLADAPASYRAKFKPCPHCLRNFDNRSRRRHTLACLRQQRERRSGGCAGYFDGSAKS